MTIPVTYLTHPGLKPYLRYELQSRFNVAPTSHETIPAQDTTQSADEALKTCYLSQTIHRATLTITTDTFTTVDDITVPDTADLSFLGDTAYRVTCTRIGDHSFTSVDIEQQIGGQLNEQGYTNVDLTQPENTVFVYIYDDAYHIGLDLVGRDLSKRQYKVFSSSDGINASLGYAFIQEASIPEGRQVVNPFSRDGVIPIETALHHCGTSVNHYTRNFRFDSLGLIDFFDVEDRLDEVDDDLTDDGTTIHCYDRNFRNLKAQKKNAKIAGVEDHIEFSRFEPEYLDLKFNDFTVDLIYGRPKEPSRHVPEDKLKQIYHDLFRYGKYVLTQDGKMVFLVKEEQPLLSIAKQFTLKVERKTQLRYKHLDYTVLTLRRKHPDALEATHL